jgi:hypothetical protein
LQDFKGWVILRLLFSGEIWRRRGGGGGKVSHYFLTPAIVRLAYLMTDVVCLLQVPRYCSHHQDVDGATLVCEEPCLWCYSVGASRGSEYCSGCKKMILTVEPTKSFKYEDTIVRLADTLALAFPGVVVNVRKHLKIRYDGDIVAEGDVAFDVELSKTCTLTVCVEVDGSYHKQMLPGKDALRTLVRAKKYHDDNRPFVLFRMRYTQNETNVATTAEKVLLQTQQWLVFVIRNADKFVKAKRTIFYHNYPNQHDRIPDVLKKYFAVVVSTCPPVPTSQVVATTHDLTLARAYEAVTKAGYAGLGGKGYNGILKNWEECKARHGAPDIQAKALAATLQTVCGLNWHNRIMPSGARSALHAPKSSVPRESFVPMQFIAASVGVKDSPMNIWQQDRPLGEFQAPILTDADFAAMAAWARGIDLQSDDGLNLKPDAVRKAAAALETHERLSESATF